MTARERDESIAALAMLDRAIDADRRELLVRAIMARVAPELRRRAARRGALASIRSLARPALAAAALILIASGVVIGTVAGRGTPTQGVLADVDDLARPRGAAPVWVSEVRRPSVEDLLIALHEDPR